jgi:hypothetical protein
MKVVDSDVVLLLTELVVRLTTKLHQAKHWLLSA